MRNAWVLDLRAVPPKVLAIVSSDDDETFAKTIRVLVAAYPESHFTIVQEIGASPVEVAA